MPYINLSQATKISRSTALNVAIGANATVVIYDGTYPATPDMPPLANTLVTFACNTQAFGLPTITANTVTLTSLTFPPSFCIANGVAGWARIANASGVAVIDLDVGMSNTASIVMNSTNLIATIPVQITAITITEQ